MMILYGCTVGVVQSGNDCGRRLIAVKTRKLDERNSETVLDLFCLDMSLCDHILAFQPDVEGNTPCTTHILINYGSAWGQISVGSH